MKRIFVALTMLLLMAGFFIVPVESSVDTAYIRLTLLNQDPDPAEPGKYVEVRWKVVKYGNDEIKDLTFELMPDYPFSFDSIDTPIKEVGDWSGYSEEDDYYTLYYKLKVADDALEGDYDIDLKYTSSSGIGGTLTYKIKVGEETLPELVLGEVKSSPIKLLADTDENEFSVQLLNIGDGQAENVFVSLDLPDNFKSSYSYSTEKNLGNIAAHSSSTAQLYIDIDESVKEGDYPAVLNVRYKVEDEDTYSDLKIPINLEVKSKPSFKLESVTYDKKVIMPGDSVSINVNLKNTGSDEVDSVSIKAFKESSQPIDFIEKSDYVGTLKVDEQGQGILTLDVDKSAAPKKYILDLEIRSIYNGEVFIQKEQIPLVISESEQKIDMRNILTGVLVVIIIVLFVLLLKKNK